MGKEILFPLKTNKSIHLQEGGTFKQFKKEMDLSYDSICCQVVMSFILGIWSSVV